MKQIIIVTKIVFIAFSLLIISCHSKNNLEKVNILDSDSSILFSNGVKSIKFEKDPSEITCGKSSFLYDTSLNNIYVSNGCKEVVLLDARDLHLKNKIKFDNNEFTGKELSIKKVHTYIALLKGRYLLLLDEDLTRIYNLTDSLFKEDPILLKRKSTAFEIDIVNDSLNVSYKVDNIDQPEKQEQVNYTFGLSFKSYDSSQAIKFFINNESPVPPIFK